MNELGDPKNSIQVIVAIENVTKNLKLTKVEHDYLFAGIVEIQNKLIRLENLEKDGLKKDGLKKVK